MGDLVQRAKVDAKDRRILARYECGWCQQSLALPECGAIWTRCSEADRQTRRDKCLAAHKGKALGAGE